MSVFWRGAAHKWESALRSEAPEVHLCAYEEPIRQFLLGTSPLPDDVALTVIVCPNGSVLNPPNKVIVVSKDYEDFISGFFAIK